MVRQPNRDQGGFTYLAVLILVVILTGALATAAVRWTTIDQRARELQLLRDGAAVRAAIGAYYESSPGTVKRYPPNLIALLQDARYLGTRRYLRKVPTDPMKPGAQFVIIRAPDGGVLGVNSSSSKSPFKTDAFSLLDAPLAGAEYYSEWQFIYVPTATIPPGDGYQHQ
jgi:type II secretory pathway pseudopilin PulG